MASFLDRSVAGSEYERFVSVIHETLPGKLHFETLWRSAAYLAGMPLTREALVELSHRLSGNRVLLRRRLVVLPWVVQQGLEWVPLQIMAVRRELSARGRAGAVFTFKVLAGTSCPMLIRNWWSWKFTRTMLARHFGFSRHPGDSRRLAKYLYTQIEQLVTLRCYGLIDPDKCKPKEPVFSRVKFPPSVQAWNREQLKHRFRVDPGYTCPAQFLNTFPCHCCALGYYTCRAAVHAHDYVFQACTGCGKDSAPFDPGALGEKQCVNCTRRAAWIKK